MQTAHIHVDRQSPTAYRALVGVATAVTGVAADAGLTRALVELVNVRVSQLNGCPSCLEIHTRKAAAAGVTDIYISNQVIDASKLQRVAALALRRLAPVLPIALAMSRGEGASKDAPTELFARARKLLAGPVNAILLDELTAGLLSAHFDVRSSEDRLLLLGELRIPDGARTLLGKPTPCVGRERELATLAALFNECVEAPLARVALVVAPPGMGKSRLAHELVHRLRRRHRPRRPQRRTRRRQRPRRHQRRTRLPRRPQARVMARRRCARR